MIVDFCYLLMWAGLTWVAGAASIGDRGPYGLGAWMRSMWPADYPSTWWVAAVCATITLGFVGCLWNAIALGHRKGMDGVLRDGAGHPIWRFGPFTGRRR